MYNKTINDELFKEHMLIEEKLNMIENLQENWNSYGAFPIDPEIIKKVRDIISHLPFIPQVHLTNDGVIQLEYENEYRYLEFTILLTDIECYICTQDGNKEKEIVVKNIGEMIDVIDKFHKRGHIMMDDRMRTIARDTLSIFDKGSYNYNTVNGQQTVPINHLAGVASKNTVLIKEDTDIMEYDLQQRKFEVPASILVLNQSVTDIFINSDERYGVLNFASAYNPGGGFLGGSMAQEESLCYCSNLYYLQLLFKDEFYNYNKQFRTKCYTDRMIYTPDTVFIKNSLFHLLPNPKLANVLTSPAVNLRAALDDKEDEKFCLEIMKQRMYKILLVFANSGNDRIILGAYGCGIFRNDPTTIAEYWKEMLDAGFKYQFKEIVFAVYDTSFHMDTYNSFQEIIMK